MNIARGLVYNSIWIGYLIPEGTYGKVYSRHEKVLNFVHNDLIFTLGNDEIAPAPLRIVGLKDITAIQEFTLKAGCVSFFGLPEVRGIIYHPLTLPSEYKEANMQHAFDLFKQHYHPLCVQSLLDGKAKGGFSIALAQRFSEGYLKLKEGKYLEGVAYFRQTGYGLSPAGDDFLVGMLVFLGWQSRFRKKELSKIRDAVFFASRSKNLLVNTFLQQAHSLNLCRDWSDFLLSLTGEIRDVEAMLQKILQHGSSSGSDELSGFFAAWRIFAEMERQRSRLV